MCYSYCRLHWTLRGSWDVTEHVNSVTGVAMSTPLPCLSSIQCTDSNVSINPHLGPRPTPLGSRSRVRVVVRYGTERERNSPNFSETLPTSYKVQILRESCPDDLGIGLLVTSLSPAVILKRKITVGVLSRLYRRNRDETSTPATPGLSLSVNGSLCVAPLHLVPEIKLWGLRCGPQTRFWGPTEGPGDPVGDGRWSTLLPG